MSGAKNLIEAVVGGKDVSSIVETVLQESKLNKAMTDLIAQYQKAVQAVPEVHRKSYSDRLAKFVPLARAAKSADGLKAAVLKHQPPGKEFDKQGPDLEAWMVRLNKLAMEK